MKRNPVCVRVCARGMRIMIMRYEYNERKRNQEKCKCILENGFYEYENVMNIITTYY